MTTPDWFKPSMMAVDQAERVRDLLAEVDALRARLAEAEAERDSLRRFKAGVDEALNSGDGAYRP